MYISSNESCRLIVAFWPFTRSLDASLHVGRQNLGAVLHVDSRNLGASLHADSRNLGASLHADSRSLGASLHADSRSLGASLHTDSRSLGASLHAKKWCSIYLNGDKIDRTHCMTSMADSNVQYIAIPRISRQRSSTSPLHPPTLPLSFIHD